MEEEGGGGNQRGSGVEGRGEREGRTVRVVLNKSDLFDNPVEVVPFPN